MESRFPTHYGSEMIQGDQDWIDLAMLVAIEDTASAARYNSVAMPDRALRLYLGPVPFLGALATAPIVVLMTHPETDIDALPGDYAYRRDGWPFSALHPEAPIGVGETWTRRTEELTAKFGAQHVANSIAALFLTPWRAMSFDERLRLPSRKAMLGLAESAAARDATLLLLRGAESWLESTELAALSPTRLIQARNGRAMDISPETLGFEGWDRVCKRICVHAWI